jgi:flavin reductase (DIM6/NTAB) family NADH-FMN oxidoreductase RutF
MADRPGVILANTNMRERKRMSKSISLELDDSLWDHVFQVAPLVMIGTREPDGGYDFAPKSRIVNLTPQHFGFVCRESHATYRNVVRERAFTVSWPGPRQIVMTSAAAAPRCEDGEKKTLKGLPTIAAKQVDGQWLADCSLTVECRLDRVIDDLGDDDLVIGRVVAAWASPDAMRNAKTPDRQVVHEHPILAYLHPSQFATIDKSVGFPFPKGFTRG